jgi:arylesterase/paraoxonase
LRRWRLALPGGAVQFSVSKGRCVTFKIFWRVFLAGVVAAALVSGFILIRLKSRLGDFTTLKPHFEGACTPVAGLPGAEDMAVDRTARRIWVSSQDRRKPGERGAIYLMPLDGFPAAPMRIDVTLGQPKDFHPQGISLWTGSDGRQVLFAVNHAAKSQIGGAGSRVEIFDVDASGLLKHRLSVPANAYPRLNDVAGAGPDAFYATVESVHARGSWMERLTLLTREESGSVVFWKNGKFRRMASGLNFANSVALTPDGKTLYATGTFGKDLRIYGRNPDTDELKLQEVVYLGSAPDNIDIAANGDIWIAAHPKLSALLAYMSNPKARAPSQALIVERDISGRGGDVHEVLLSDGHDLAAATIAIADGDRIFLSGAFDDRALACVAPQKPRRDISHRFTSKD